jgi:hypothetical protein
MATTGKEHNFNYRLYAAVFLFFIFFPGYSSAASYNFDVDVDGKADIAVWRPSDGYWYALHSGTPGTYSATLWGAPTDIPVPADYDGDGKTDIAVRRPSTGIWYILLSSAPGTYSATLWGAPTDIAVPADYDGDGKTDIAVRRPSTGIWYILLSSAPGTYSATLWGAPTDIPVPANYDGDGKTDIAVRRPSTGIWYILLSSAPGTYSATLWGAPTDIPVPADYDGDGKTDIAVRRPSTGIWYILLSSAPGTYTATLWGLPTDIPVPADYNGDGKTDIAVWRSETGTWYILSSSEPGSYTATAWGMTADIPVTSRVGIQATPISLAISPINPTVAVGNTPHFSALATFNNGATQDVTSSAAWSSSNESIAKVFRSGTQGYVVAISDGTAGISATYLGISAQAELTVVPEIIPPVPHIESVSPTGGGAGTQVSIMGSGFGVTQGSGYVLLGTALGIVASWSDTQITATVAASSATGMVQVRQAGQLSNSISFNIIGAPTIVSVAPTSGVAGTRVTVAGSGFEVSQGNGTILLGDMNGIVTSWSDSQIVAEVAAGAVSGNVQVLQNGTLSNAFAFIVGTPQISSASPNPVASGAAVTIIGTGFGATQGDGQVWLGSKQGVVVSWSDTQIAANVALDALSGIARVQQNGIWSNAISLSVTNSGPVISILPNLLNLVVGDTASLQALDEQKHTVTGLTWVSNNASVVSLSPDDPPLLTAVGIGHATITAGNGSADVTVHAEGSVPSGTIQWSNPGDGSGIYSIVPAVPMETGAPDIFAYQGSGNVTALNFDGTTAWTADVSNGFTVPDFDGGLVYVTEDSMQRLDAITGQPSFSQTFANQSHSFSTNQIAIATDGTLFAVDGDRILGIDSVTGSQKFSVSMHSGQYYESSAWEDCSIHVDQHTNYPNVLKILVAGDGYAYILYDYRNYSSSSNHCDVWGYHTGDLHLQVLRISPTGSANDISIASWDESGSQSFEDMSSSGRYWGYLTDTNTIPVPWISGSLITNADSGVLVSWRERVDNDGYSYTFGSFPNCPIFFGCDPNNHSDTWYRAYKKYHLTEITGGSVSSNVETQAEFSPVLQREDGTYVGRTFEAMVAFNGSGNIMWSAPPYTPLAITSDDGVIARYDATTSIVFDANGNVTGLMPSIPTTSWTGLSYASSIGGVASISQAPIGLGSTFYSVAGGNPSANGTAVASALTLEQQTLFALVPRGPECKLSGVKTALLGAPLALYESLKQSLLGSGALTCQSCSTFFNTETEMASIFGQLTEGVTRQVPWDGPKSTISLFDAGAYENEQTAASLKVNKETPMCSKFMPYKNTKRKTQKPSGITVAAAQLQPPAVDVYINSDETVLNQYLAQSTILHEALHNLSGWADTPLANKLKVDISPCPKGQTCVCGGSYCINIKLEDKGCANSR